MPSPQRFLGMGEPVISGSTDNGPASILIYLGTLPDVAIVPIGPQCSRSIGRLTMLHQSRSPHWAGLMTSYILTGLATSKSWVAPMMTITRTPTPPNWHDQHQLTWVFDDSSSSDRDTGWAWWIGMNTAIYPSTGQDCPGPARLLIGRDEDPWQLDPLDVTVLDLPVSQLNLKCQIRSST